MVSNPPVSMSKALVIGSHSIAFLMTFFRLVHRFNTRRLWWDDFWAFVSIFSDIFVLIIFILTTSTIPGITTSGPGTKPNLSTRLFFRLGTLIFYTTTLWAARVSVAVTIVRLLNPGHFRTIARMAAFILGAFWLTLVVQKIFICGTEWRSVPDCPIPRVTGYLELGTDLAGDMWLLLSPVYMLWRMKIRPRYRRLILAIFGCGVLTTAICLVHIYFIVCKPPANGGNSKSPGWLGITGHLQLGVSIVVCNLLVLLTYIYRVFWNDQEDDSEDSSEDYSREENLVGGVNMDECPRSRLQGRSLDLSPSANQSHNTHTTILTSVTEQITFTDIETSLSGDSYFNNSRYTSR